MLKCHLLESEWKGLHGMAHVLKRFRKKIAFIMMLTGFPARENQSLPTVTGVSPMEGGLDLHPCRGCLGGHLPALSYEPGWPIDWKCHRALSLSRKSLARSDIKNESWACCLWLLKRLQEGNSQSSWYIFIKGDLRTLYPHSYWEASFLLPLSGTDNQRGTKFGIYGLLGTVWFQSLQGHSVSFWIWESAESKIQSKTQP